MNRGKPKASLAPLEEAAQKLGEEGARRFARWDAELLRDLVSGPAARLWRDIHDLPGARAVIEAYLRLAVEAIGLGYVDRAGFQAVMEARAAPNLIALLWLGTIPAQGLTGPPEADLARLAAAWNLGEGLLGEAAWLNRYAAGVLRERVSLDDLEARLGEAIEPALVVRAPAAFRGPFAVTRLDGTEVDDRFLPGEMHLPAPVVVCVHDRKRDNVCAGVFLREKGASSFLPPGPCLGEGPAITKAPACALGEEAVRIGFASVPLPFVAHGHRAVATPAGFCVVSAVDSQRLWVVESP